MSSRTPRQYHVAGQRPLSPDSIEIPAEAVTRFLNRLEPASGGCLTLRRLGVGRPRTSTRPKTYAKVRWYAEDGKRLQIKAHRLALILRIGPVPDGRLACHRCDRPACVAGAHLYAGTFANNAADRVRSRKAQKRGELPALHPTRYPVRRPDRMCVEVRPG